MQDCHFRQARPRTDRTTARRYPYYCTSVRPYIYDASPGSRSKGGAQDGASVTFSYTIGKLTDHTWYSFFPHHRLWNPPVGQCGIRHAPESQSSLSHTVIHPYSTHTLAGARHPQLLSNRRKNDSQCVNRSSPPFLAAHRIHHATATSISGTALCGLAMRSCRKK